MTDRGSPPGAAGRLRLTPLQRPEGETWLAAYTAPGIAWNVARATGVSGERVDVMAAGLAAILADAAPQAGRWVAGIAGPPEEVRYLLELIAVEGGVALTEVRLHRRRGLMRRSADVVVDLPARAVVLAALLGGEGARSTTTLVLAGADADIAALLDLGRAGHAVARAAAAAVQRAGEDWALVTSRAGHGPRLAGQASPGGAAALGWLRPARGMRGGRWRPVLATLGVLFLLGALAGVARNLVAPSSTLRQATSPPTLLPSPAPVLPSPPVGQGHPLAGPAPMPRQRAASAFDPGRQQLVLFGGVSQTATAEDLGDTWVWSGSLWSQRSPDRSPSPRFGAVMAYDAHSGTVVLYGGQSRAPAPRVLSDTWRWDGTTWAPTAPGTASPQPDSAPVGMAYDTVSSRLVLVTAAGAASAPQTWTWNGRYWLLASPAAGTPAVQWMVDDAERGHVVGIALNESTGPGSVAATWTWDGTDWVRRHPAQEVSVEPDSATVGYDIVTSTVVLVEVDFINNAGADAGGTWLWNGSSWRQRAGGIPDVVSAFDVTQPVVGSRDGHLVLIGGPRGGQSYRNVWRWNGAGWTPL